MMILLTFFLIAFSSGNAAIHSLEYSDLEETGADCSPGDTCATGKNKTFFTTNCECDSQCQWYDDCCIDALMTRSMKARTNLMCLPDGTFNRGAYAINKCRKDWTGPAEIRLKCETVNNMSDPAIAAPVTDVVRSVTYRNRYCSECNRAENTHLRSWNIKLNCESLPPNVTNNITTEFVGNKLTYRDKAPNRNKWGIYNWNNDAQRETFYPCEITFVRPEFLMESVRLCRPNIVSRCAPTWRLRSVERNCRAYMAVVYIGSKVYRNPHCALCNNENLAIRKCALGLDKRRKPSIPLSILLDFSDYGPRETSRCKTEEFYDVYSKKCRKRLLCLPELQRNGKCAPR